MSHVNIKKEAARAASSCFLYYTGKNLSTEILSQIEDLIPNEETSQNYKDYEKQYNAYVESQS